jgi:myo-inositol-1(or 4)-monophosphatase
MRPQTSSTSTDRVIEAVMNRESMRDVLVASVRAAGDILRSHAGRVGTGREKESASSVVTEADLEAEACIVRRIQEAFPGHGIIAEESGVQPGREPFTWVIDPLDGTSNFVAGLPWYGVQVGILEGTTPLLAAMYLPATDVLYLSERGRGVWVGDRRLELTPETELRRVLCAFGFDGAVGLAEARRGAELLARVASGVRNIRATNSLIDFCLNLEGNLGGCVNLNPKIWDIVPASLMFPEAGGVFTDLEGRPIEWDLGPSAPERVYPIVGASRSLHPGLIHLLRGSAAESG